MLACGWESEERASSSAFKLATLLVTHDRTASCSIKAVQSAGAKRAPSLLLNSSDPFLPVIPDTGCAARAYDVAAALVWWLAVRLALSQSLAATSAAQSRMLWAFAETVDLSLGLVLKDCFRNSQANWISAGGLQNTVSSVAGDHVHQAVFLLLLGTDQAGKGVEQGNQLQASSCRRWWGPFCSTKRLASSQICT